MYGGSLIQQPFVYRNPQGTPSPQPGASYSPQPGTSYSPQPSPYLQAGNLTLPPFGATSPQFNHNNIPSYDPSNTFLPPFSQNNLATPVAGGQMADASALPNLPAGYPNNMSDLNANSILEMNSSEMRQLLSTEFGNRDIDERGLSDSLSRLLNNWICCACISFIYFCIILHVKIIKSLYQFQLCKKYQRNFLKISRIGIRESPLEDSLELIDLMAEIENSDDLVEKKLNK